MNSKWIKATLALMLVVGTSWGSYKVMASDHDDGSQATATNNLNLTDLFAFREDNQSGNPADKGNLVLIMNSNGHTSPNQQVFFNTSGVYDFHISRVATAAINTAPTGVENVILRFTFGEPDASLHQSVNLQFIQDGNAQNASTGANGGATSLTTTLAEGKANFPRTNSLMVNGQMVSVFAGLREDPFFFDVEQFFKVRAGALGTGPVVGFRSASTAVDGFAKQNVNSIVVRVPLSLLQTGAAEPAYDVWITTGK